MTDFVFVKDLLQHGFLPHRGGYEQLHNKICRQFLLVALLGRHDSVDSCGRSCLVLDAESQRIP